MEYQEIEIPEGYEAEIKDGKVIVRKKEEPLTEFEQSVRVCVTKNLTTHIKDGNGREMSSTVFIDDVTAKQISQELLELARKELAPSEDELEKKYQEGYNKGRFEGYDKGYKDAADVYSKNALFRFPTFPPCYAPGGVCTNPQMDCINCPKQSACHPATTNISGEK